MAVLRVRVLLLTVVLPGIAAAVRRLLMVVVHLSKERGRILDQYRSRIRDRNEERTGNRDWKTRNVQVGTGVSKIEKSWLGLLIWGRGTLVVLRRIRLLLRGVTGRAGIRRVVGHFLSRVRRAGRRNELTPKVDK